MEFWADRDASLLMWTNLALAAAVLACAGLFVLSLAGEIASRLRRRWGMRRFVMIHTRREIVASGTGD